MTTNDYPETVKKLRTEYDFLRYLQLLKEIIHNYVIFITVCDTGAAPYYTPEHAAAMAELGLKINMLQRYRQPYIAVIDHGKVIREICSEKLDEPLTLEGKINNHDIWIYSAGFNYQVGIGTGAYVCIDGANFLRGCRGFNFLVFDVEKDEIIDTRGFDTFDLAKCKNSSTNPIERYFWSFMRKYGGGVQLITFQPPRFPPKGNKNLSNWEKFIQQQNEYVAELVKNFPFKVTLNEGWFTIHTTRNKDKMEKIWKQKAFPFCKDYKSFEEFFDAFYEPPSYANSDGSINYCDYHGAATNLQNGYRVPTDQPIEPKRNIFFIGPSWFFSWGATDCNTIESYLQRKLNEYLPKEKISVHNRCFTGVDIHRDVRTLQTLRYQQGDIVIFAYGPIWGIPHCDLSFKSIRPHAYGEIFTDTHFSQNGNRMIADGIFEFLQKHNFFEEKLVGEWTMPEPEDNDADEDEQLHDYRKNLRKIYREQLAPRVGAIVMNCNPFTLGHRYLVEQALNRCDRLIVFVVEEDKSVFPFADRLQLVKENLADLKNVLVLPSGEFIISSRTFEEYFNKESLQERKIDTSTDVTLFASKIAPCLNISVRFAGEEPFDTVTRQYNETMARILPQYGLEFVEIPRLTTNGTAISASRVRALAKAREFNKLKTLVPKKTLKYLKQLYGG